MPLTGFAFGCASNADAFMPSPQQFTYFQGGGFDMTFLSFMEVDIEGNVNVSKLGKKPYLTAGCGGFVDITAHARKIVFSGWFEAGAEIELTETGLRVAKPGKFTKMVTQVEHVTFSGARAREQGQEVLYVTERCVIRLTDQGLAGDRNHARDRPCAGHCGGVARAGERGGQCDGAAGVAAGAGCHGVAAMTVHLMIEGGVAEMRLDNPAKLNALTPEMLTLIAQHCDAVEARGDVVAVLVTATGHRAFCTGADINAWAGLAPAEFARDWVRRGHRIFDRLARLGKPTIAVLEGHAYGGGLELAAACDIRVMSPKARIALPETGVGIVPGWSGTQRLARLLPEPVIKEMALFGRSLTAERAFALGFVAEVAEDPAAAALEIADRLRATSQRATEVAKYMLHAGSGEDAGAMIEALGSGMTAASEDKAEGVAAFRAKRKPEFPGA